MKRILISAELQKTLRDYAYVDKDNERCGLLAGWETDNLCAANQFFPITNLELGQSDRFTMHPDEQMDAYDAVKKMNTDLSKVRSIMVGCFHTHPYWTGKPSNIDAAAADQIGEDWVWLIYGLKDDKLIASYWNQVLRGFLTMEIITT